MKNHATAQFSVLFLLLLSLLLSSCTGRRLSADDLAFKLLNLYPDIPPCTQYIKNAEKYTAGYLSPEEFSYLYTGEKSRLPEWNMIEELRIILSDSTEFFEIHVIKTNTASDTDEIAKLLNRRVRLIELHNKEEGDYPAKEPLLYISGRYVVLVATYDNEAALRLLKRIL